ncbi:glycosyltransferase family 90 protein [Falsiroseomonas oryziterrae]|uniref:glycosyltransferase family 90 protein n=1 Tax=Falsiroseomonas oryziterrae TaxID=2911368 RepID=UPI001F374039|nr:glycosyltransferase family 90 protein [Roseomonas sp. NPKOSM-4]
MDAAAPAAQARWGDLLDMLRAVRPEEAGTLDGLDFAGFESSHSPCNITLHSSGQAARLALSASQRLLDFKVAQAVSALGRIARSLACLQAALEDVLAEHAGPVRLPLGLDDDGGQRGLCFDRPKGSARPLMPDLYLLRHLRDRAPIVPLDVEGFPAAHAARRPVLFWRGVSTGPRIRSLADLEANPRVRACLAAREALGDLVDMRVVQLIIPSELTAEAEAWANARDLLGPRVPAQAYAANRMTLDLPGNAAAWGTYARYLEGTLVLRVETRHELIYHERLLPWVHYVPVASDLHDLAERVRWALAEPKHAAAIAHAGHAAMVAILRDVPDLTRAALRQAIAHYATD